MNQSHLEGLLKDSWSHPVSDSVGPRWGLRMYISKSSQVMPLLQSAAHTLKTTVFPTLMKRHLSDIPHRRRPISIYSYNTYKLPPKLRLVFCMCYQQGIIFFFFSCRMEKIKDNISAAEDMRKHVL